VAVWPAKHADRVRRAKIDAEAKPLPLHTPHCSAVRYPAPTSVPRRAAANRDVDGHPHATSSCAFRLGSMPCSPNRSYATAHPPGLPSQWEQPVAETKGDAHNEVRTPWAVPIRHGTLDAPPYLVALADPDPLGGSVDVDRLSRVAPTGQPIGIVSGATMQRVREAIYTLFAG
jgi:mRNA interferase MazF